MRHAIANPVTGSPAPARSPITLVLPGLAVLGAVVAAVTAAMDGLWAAALVLGVVFGAALLRWPWLGVVFIFTTILFKYPDFVYRLPMSPNRMVSGVLLLLLLGAVALRQRMDFFRTPVFLGFALVTALLVVNVFFVGGEDAPARLAGQDLTDRSLGRLVTQFILLTLFGAFIRSRRQLLAVVGVFLLALIITVPGAVTHTYDVTAQGEQNLERGRATAGAGGIQAAENANRLAFLAALGISFFWFAMQHYRNALLRALGWVLIPVFVLTVFLSGSRSGLINLGLLVLLLSLQSGVRPARLAGIALVILVITAIAGFLVPPVILDRITTFLPSEASTSATKSIEFRELMVQVGLKLFSESPFTGVGVGNVRWMTALDPQSGGLPLSMHNAYLLVLVEGGLVFLGAYLLLFWLTWRSLQRSARAAAARPEIGLGWLVLATRTNLILLLTFSLFAEAWNETPFVLILCCAMALAVFYGPARAGQPSGSSRWVASPSFT
jgi:O-antigen ligase